MKKPPKPWRREKGKKRVGNWFITPAANDGDQHPINLGTKDARKALERAAEYGRTRKRNFQDDLDGAAERAIAAAEGAGENPALASAAPPIIEQPAARVVAAPAAAPAPPAPAPAPSATPPPSPEIGTGPQPAAGAPAPSPAPAATDWREDARAAAATAAAASDSAAAKGPQPSIDPNMIEQFVKTAAGFMFSGQIFMQGKAIEWWTGEKVAPVLPTLERAVKAGQLPEEALIQVQTVRDLSIAGYASFIKRKIDIENLPDWAVGLIAAASLSSIQYSFAAVAKHQKAEAKKRGGSGDPLGMPTGTPAAPPAKQQENGAGAEAL